MSDDYNADYPTVKDVLALAAEIRRVDGAHDKGAAALSEALWPFLAKVRADERERCRAELREKVNSLESDMWMFSGADLWSILRDWALREAFGRE